MMNLTKRVEMLSAAMELRQLDEFYLKLWHLKGWRMADNGARREFEFDAAKVSGFMASNAYDNNRGREEAVSRLISLATVRG